MSSYQFSTIYTLKQGENPGYSQTSRYHMWKRNTNIYKMYRDDNLLIDLLNNVADYTFVTKWVIFKMNHINVKFTVFNSLNLLYFRNM